MTQRWVFPFSAIVEQDALKAALLLNAVDPLLGGVLIRGQKGTGKSTAARALGRLLPEIEVVEGCPFNSDPGAPFVDESGLLALGVNQETAKPARRSMPFVELPLNATEDRLAGTLHWEKVLQTGRRQFEPGLLASANRGVLYVDEVNLLDDHLVDLLLDSAASGLNVVEREGVSFAHPARFLLIGTMNPEEGELRPQFLDRFGLCVTLDRITNLASREAIVRRRLAFDSDPESFAREWADEDRAVAAQIDLARSALEQVEVPDSILALAARLGHELNAAGHRADLTMIKAARAHAALMEKPRADLEDVATAARLALPHRVPASPLDSPEQIQQSIDRVFRRLAGEETELASEAVDDIPDAVPDAEEDLDEMALGMQVPGSAAAGSVVLSFIKKKTAKPSLNPTRA
ncbi:MAG: ATP-binding protein [Verrucomicrobia bacterium]|nr:ATP-binding protein [Verrucomicrobiota bacterium]